MRKNVTDPFPKDCMGSHCFRIPAMLVTKKGTVLAASDARWSHGLDAAGNLETVVARSSDGGQTWERQFVNHYDDVEDGSERCIYSAAFIDPILAQDSQGVLYLLVDMCPAYVGGWAVDGMVCGKEREGRHPNGKLALKKMESYTCAETQVLNEDTYPYYIGEAGEDGFAPVLGIKDDLPLEDYLVDDQWYLYRRTGTGAEKVLIPQLDGHCRPTEHLVHANIFYAASPLKAYPSFHIVLRTSTDDGKTWSKLRILGDQIGASGFTGVCPGKGFALTYHGKERVLIPIYDNNLGVEFTSVIYTEDQGLTWKRSGRASLTGTTSEGQRVKSSESQIIQLPDGRLRMFSRSQIDQIIYTDSFDGGETWGEYRREPKLTYCGNCMVSFINYSRKIEGKPAVIACYPGGDGKLYHRVNGIIAIGLIDEATGEIAWKYHYPVNQGPYYYSCVTELPDGNIALYYEYEEYALHYVVYTIEELKVV